MARAEMTVLTNMCMVRDDEGRVLVEERLDPVWPGCCFPGGHVEPGESFHDAVVREVFEETGLTIEDPRLCGVKQFTDRQGRRYVVFLYIAERFSGTLHDSDEGPVRWMTRAALGAALQVPDFADMLRVFDEADTTELFYDPSGPVRFF